MKLVLASPYPEIDDKVTGGVEGACKVLVEGLLEIPDIEIYVLAPCSKRQPGVEKRGRLIIVWIKSSILPGVLDYWTVYRCRLNAALKRVAPDIVHYQGVLGWMSGSKYPRVATLHGIGEKDLLYSRAPFLWLRYVIMRYVESTGRKKAKDIIVISKYLIDELGTQISGRKWDIENPVAGELFGVKRSYTEGQVLYVGRINRRKNILGMLSVFSSVLKEMPHATLTIAGDPDNSQYFDECIQYVNQNKLNGSVNFLGGVNRSKVTELLSSSACLILLSHQETAPIIVEEAMACGLPVIASNVCGLPYLVEDGKSGFLVDSTKESVVSKKVIDVLGEHSTNERMGEMSKLIAVERFHYKVVALKTYGVYSEVLKRSNEIDLVHAP